MRSISALLLLGFVWSSPAHAQCREDVLNGLDQVMARTNTDHLILVVAGLREACALPSSVDRAFKMIVQGGPSQYHDSIDPIAEERALWARACKGGPRVISDMAKLAPPQEAQLLWSACNVGALDIATVEEWQSVGPTAPLAIAVHAFLRESKQPPMRVRNYTRALAGLDERKPRGFGDTDSALPPGRDPALLIALAGSTGNDRTEDLAGQVQSQSAQLAPCFRGVKLPHDFGMNLTVSDGKINDGSLITIIGNKVKPTSVSAAFDRCLLARAARLRFDDVGRPIVLQLAIVSSDSMGSANRGSGGLGLGNRKVGGFGTIK